ncbi:MAG: HAD hydrolase family protein [Oscillospiraceae bacterium]|nr:HAD hydrolase family protein [Oscillospiraceae bacterium]
MIKIVLFDIDGVLTDGSLLVDYNGNELKQVNLVDIDAVHAIKKQGFLIGAITGENTALCNYFEKRFPWDYFYFGRKDKLDVIKEIETITGISSCEICYIGDGFYDIEPLSYVGLSVCPNNAIKEVKDIVDICLTRNGGSGCIWEFRNILLELKEKGE